MHIFLQLISSKSAVFFISDENLGWLPISLLLIISFSFDLDYDCSVRHTHLFISFAWWDGLFGNSHRLMHIKNGFRSKLEPCESAHMAVAFSLYVCKSCISGSLLRKAQTIWASCILFFLSLDVFASEKPYTYTKMHIINTVYNYALPTANLFSDSLLMTWNLYHEHQTSFPMCRERTEYLSRAHTDEHRCTSVCVER